MIKRNQPAQDGMSSDLLEPQRLLGLVVLVMSAAVSTEPVGGKRQSPVSSRLSNNVRVTKACGRSAIGPLVHQ